MKINRTQVYKTISIVAIIILAVLFTFPLYWIITGAFKTKAEIISATPSWWPSEWVLTNFENLFDKQYAPLWELHIPFGSFFSANGKPIVFFSGPMVPAAIRWLVNTVFMAAILPLTPKSMVIPLSILPILSQPFCFLLNNMSTGDKG